MVLSLWTGLVTADGVHVMAYLGSRTWIEADPDAQEVLEITLPTQNSWFLRPVVMVRWCWLEPLIPEDTDEETRE